MLNFNLFQVPKKGFNHVCKGLAGECQDFVGLGCKSSKCV